LIDVVGQLCPSCGLCCNGVLFADVELQCQDKPEALASAGLPLQSKGRKLAFPQPCSCLKDGWCRIYRSRPARCRSFECGTLKRVQAEELTLAQALRVVRRVQSHVQRVERWLQEIGNHESETALLNRYTRVMEQPFVFSNCQAEQDCRPRLMASMARLMQLLQRHFLS
jgi:uncharacterized protein